MSPQSITHKPTRASRNARIHADCTKQEVGESVELAEREPFTMTPTWLTFDQPCMGMPSSLWHLLRACSDNTSGVAFKGVPWLAEQMGVSERSIFNWLAILERRGALKRERRYWTEGKLKGKLRWSKYILAVNKPFPVADSSDGVPPVSTTTSRTESQAVEATTHTTTLSPHTERGFSPILNEVSDHVLDLAHLDNPLPPKPRNPQARPKPTGGGETPPPPRPHFESVRRLTPRQQGRNPRALGTNPRSQATAEAEQRAREDKRNRGIASYRAYVDRSLDAGYDLTILEEQLDHDWRYQNIDAATRRERQRILNSSETRSRQ